MFLTGYEIARRNTAELVRDKGSLVVDLVINRTRSHLEPARAQIDYLSDLLADDRVDLGDRDALGALLVASLAAVPQVSVVAFVDPDLRVLRAFRNRPGAPVRLSDWSDDPSFRHAMNRLGQADAAYWGELFVAEDAGLTFINIRKPVRRDGRLVGGLIAGVSIQELSAFLSELRDAFTYNAFVLSGRRFVLAHPLLQQGYPGLSDEHPLPHLGGFGDPVLSEIWSSNRRPRIEASLAGPVEVRAVDYVGRTYVFLFRKLDAYGGEPWFVGTYVPLADVGAQVERLGLIPLIDTLILVVALAMAWLLGRTLSQPVRRLALAARRIRDLELDGLAPTASGVFRELNEAVSAFNAMTSGLRSFATYVPHSLVRRLMRQNGRFVVRSEERDVTILFTDIVGSTALAEALPAAAVADFLNQHFALVDECVEAEQGTVDKYMGDALMAFWGAPEGPAGPCRAGLPRRPGRCSSDPERQCRATPGGAGAGPASHRHSQRARGGRQYRRAEPDRLHDRRRCGEHDGAAAGAGEGAYRRRRTDRIGQRGDGSAGRSRLRALPARPARVARPA